MKINDIIHFSKDHYDSDLLIVERTSKTAQKVLNMVNSIAPHASIPSLDYIVKNDGIVNVININELSYLSVLKSNPLLESLPLQKGSLKSIVVYKILDASDMEITIINGIEKLNQINHLWKLEGHTIKFEDGWQAQMKEAYVVRLQNDTEVKRFEAVEQIAKLLNDFVAISPNVENIGDLVEWDGEKWMVNVSCIQDRAEAISLSIAGIAPKYEPKKYGTPDKTVYPNAAEAWVAAQKAKPGNPIVKQ